MSYEACQDALIDVIRKVDGYNKNNAVIGDYRILQKGQTNNIVVHPGPFTRGRTTFQGGKENRWEVIIELFVKYRDDAQVQNGIRDERQLIIDKVDQYPELDNESGVFNAEITSGDEPEPVFGGDGSGPHFFMQRMICEIREDITVTEQG
ncbi:MAG: hypothetical protein ACFFD4_07540 [Candidatus Odinarchaeota archaeon]